MLIPKDQFITYNQLSQQLNVTNRTIYNDVSVLNKLLRKRGAQIIAKPHFGLKIEVCQPEDFQKFSEEMQHDKILIGDTTEIRIKKIIVYLITSLHSIKIDDLCEELYVSRSTLKNDLKKIREFIGQYDLKIECKPYEGMKIVGEEKSVRRCLAKAERSHAIKDNGFMNDTVESIGKMVKAVFKNYAFSMPQYAFHNLIIHFILLYQELK